MAYNNYFPQYYPNIQPAYQMPQNASQMPQNALPNSSNGITWVQGESAAKSFPVAAGQSVLLMDSESSSFFIKSMDQSGMPLPLRIFDYSERKSDHSESGIGKSNNSDYVSRQEFDAFKQEMMKSISDIEKGEG